MNQVFDAYARYYDLLYQDKDYAAEAEYVSTHIRKHVPNAKKILDLGCGTGAHAEHLAKMGYKVHGIDLSETMLLRAEERKAQLSPEVAALISFSCGDVRKVRINETYDVVISLFHVMSYQTTNADLEAAFETAASHLRPGGVFLFDYWYGPGVLMQTPDVRVKRLEDNYIKVVRIAEPELKENNNVVNVNYNIFIKSKIDGKIDQIHEVHKMRYLFLPELMVLANSRIWSEIICFGWMDFKNINKKFWSGFAVAIVK